MRQCPAPFLAHVSHVYPTALEDMLVRTSRRPPVNHVLDVATCGNANRCGSESITAKSSVIAGQTAFPLPPLGVDRSG